MMTITNSLEDAIRAVKSNEPYDWSEEKLDSFNRILDEGHPDMEKRYRRYEYWKVKALENGVYPGVCFNAFKIQDAKRYASKKDNKSYVNLDGFTCSMDIKLLQKMGSFQYLGINWVSFDDMDERTQSLIENLANELWDKDYVRRRQSRYPNSKAADMAYLKKGIRGRVKALECNGMKSVDKYLGWDRREQCRTLIQSITENLEIKDEIREEALNKSEWLINTTERMVSSDDTHYKDHYRDPEDKQKYVSPRIVKMTREARYDILLPMVITAYMRRTKNCKYCKRELIFDYESKPESDPASKMETEKSKDKGKAEETPKKCSLKEEKLDLKAEWDSRRASCDHYEGKSLAVNDDTHFQFICRFCNYVKGAAPEAAYRTYINHIKGYILGDTDDVTLDSGNRRQAWLHWINRECKSPNKSDSKIGSMGELIQQFRSMAVKEADKKQHLKLYPCGKDQSLELNFNAENKLICPDCKEDFTKAPDSNHLLGTSKSFMEKVEKGLRDPVTKAVGTWDHTHQKGGYFTFWNNEVIIGFTFKARRFAKETLKDDNIFYNWLNSIQDSAGSTI